MVEKSSTRYEKQEDLQLHLNPLISIHCTFSFFPEWRRNSLGEILCGHVITG